VLFHCFAYFISIFIESSVSFIFRIDSFATREAIIAVLFLLVFWFLLLLESYIYTHTHIWIALLRGFYFVLVSVLQEPQSETRGVSV
jgi:hypothetical protein